VTVGVVESAALGVGHRGSFDYNPEFPFDSQTPG